MTGFLRFIAAFLAGVIATYIIGTAVNSQFVMGAYDVDISLSERFNMTMFDISNMLAYMAVIAAALLIGFGVAAIVKRFVPKLARIAYPVAGAAALALTLGLMYVIFQTIPISGARSLAGYLAQVVAGGIGGYVFAKLLTRMKAEKITV